MSPITRMVNNINNRCSHSAPVYRPCNSCVAARLDQISKVYKSELSRSIQQENASVKEQLKKVLSSVETVVDESGELRKKIEQLKNEKTEVIDMVKDRDRQIVDLKIQVRADRTSKLKVLDLSEVEV